MLNVKRLLVVGLLCAVVLLVTQCDGKKEAESDDFATVNQAPAAAKRRDPAVAASANQALLPKTVEKRRGQRTLQRPRPVRSVVKRKSGHFVKGITVIYYFIHVYGVFLNHTWPEAQCVCPTAEPECIAQTTPTITKTTGRPFNPTPGPPPGIKCATPITLIQQNLGDNKFSRSWHHFKIGFGQTAFNFWLGLHALHSLTTFSGVYRLRIKVQSHDGKWYQSEYSHIKVGNEASGFALDLGTYSGNAGDLRSSLNGAKFSTFDYHKGAAKVNCAAKNRRNAAFWYNGDCNGNLNGFGSNFEWKGLPSPKLRLSRMWIICNLKAE